MGEPKKKDNDVIIVSDKEEDGEEDADKESTDAKLAKRDRSGKEKEMNKWPGATAMKELEAVIEADKPKGDEPTVYSGLTVWHGTVLYDHELVEISPPKEKVKLKDGKEVPVNCSLRSLVGDKETKQFIRSIKNATKDGRLKVYPFGRRPCMAKNPNKKFDVWVEVSEKHTKLGTLVGVTFKWTGVPSDLKSNDANAAWKALCNYTGYTYCKSHQPYKIFRGRYPIFCVC